MKKVSIKNEVAAVVYSNLSALKTSGNHIRFSIGLKNLGNGLASWVHIVNGGQMGRFGFVTELPEDMSEFVEGSPYMEFNLKADEFCNYLSALLDYKADISLSYDGAQVFLKVPGIAEIPLQTVEEEVCEPLLTQEYNNGFARLKLKGSDLQEVLRKGGFLGTSEPCIHHISDRVVLRVVSDKCFIYSSDTHTIAKAWCACATAFQEAPRAIYYLREVGSKMDDAGKKELQTKMQENRENPSGMVALATEHGYVSEQDISVSIASASVNTILKLFAGAEEVGIIITANYIYVNAGNVFATFSLAGEVATIYKTSVDKWEEVQWDTRIVTDKESLSRALGILRLGGDKNKVPFHLTANESGVITCSGGNKICTAVVGSEGSFSNVDAWYECKRVMDALSRLSNGNIILRFAATKGKGFPLSISNGSLDEESVNSYTYILAVTGVEEKEKEGEKTDTAAENK